MKFANWTTLPLNWAWCICMYSYCTITVGRAFYRMSQEECARLREGVPRVKVYRYNPKHLCPKLNGYGDNGQRKVWSSCGSTHCTCQLTIFTHFRRWVWCHMTTNQLAISHWTAHAVGLFRNAKSAMLRHRWTFSCIVLGTLRTNMTWVRVFL